MKFFITAIVLFAILQCAVSTRRLRRQGPPGPPPTGSPPSGPPPSGPPPTGGPGGGGMGGTPTVTPFNFTDSTTTATSDPTVTSWVKSTGYSSHQPTALKDVSKIQYTSKYAYIWSSGLPAYKVGPWLSNPNNASNQAFTFKIPRVPVENKVSKDSVGLGNIAVWINGVAAFNAEDGQSIGAWKRNAYFFEKVSFDSCNGHPQQSGNYHHHIIPVCLFDSLDSTKHSPLIGFSFDGYPIYGPFGYSSAMNSKSSIKRILSSYQIRSITTRTVLANGTALSMTSQYGPPVNQTYPLGSFIDDHEYISGSGDLDENNGRLCVTPEYPQGTYAYFTTTDSTGTPTYPYIIGPKYNGYVVGDNYAGKATPATIELTTTYFEYGVIDTTTTTSPIMQTTTTKPTTTTKKLTTTTKKPTTTTNKVTTTTRKPTTTTNKVTTTTKKPTTTTNKVTTTTKKITTTTKKPTMTTKKTTTTTKRPVG